MPLLHRSGTGRNRPLRDTFKGCIQCIVRGEFRFDVACEQFYPASYVTPVLSGGKKRIGEAPETVCMGLSLLCRKEQQRQGLLFTPRGNQRRPERHFHPFDSPAILPCNTGQIPFFICSRDLNADEQGEQ